MVMDAFTKVISKFDTRGEYISDNSLQQLIKIVEDSNKRLDAVNRISSNASTIVATAARQLFEDQPQLINPGGNAYTSRRNSTCLRDLEIILRYITYAIFTADSSVLQDRALNGLRETYLALGVPGSSVALGIQKMKALSLDIVKDQNGITPGDCTSLISEITVYFDLAAQSVV